VVVAPTFEHDVAILGAGVVAASATLPESAERRTRADRAAKGFFIMEEIYRRKLREGWSLPESG